ncbi:hypothetical protein AMAG_15420 [Allomyces macrogynus ATCC 38327]|uniref:Myb/SANT-like domain-containing protein n=1 Tax=Allomyces macrogynus (strain ATCC 38327) TaxID=578462 RepID=A0A0L0T7Y2_ALLM3|nr:hypothetical protein AMAG_15420 [Allomyces macrogynus ATCC 38327]|eukprot:KNE70664.1 hypothetical protein AMAG_15420 [Allomyces macrogynus ATCC 38327]
MAKKLSSTPKKAACSKATKSTTSKGKTSKSSINGEALPMLMLLLASPLVHMHWTVKMVEYSLDNLTCESLGDGNMYMIGHCNTVATKLAKWFGILVTGKQVKNKIDGLKAQFMLWRKYSCHSGWEFEVANGALLTLPKSLAEAIVAEPKLVTVEKGFPLHEKCEDLWGKLLTKGTDVEHLATSEDEDDLDLEADDKTLAEDESDESDDEHNSDSNLDRDNKLKKKPALCKTKGKAVAKKVVSKQPDLGAKMSKKDLDVALQILLLCSLGPDTALSPVQLAAAMAETMHKQAMVWANDQPELDLAVYLAMHFDTHLHATLTLMSLQGDERHCMYFARLVLDLSYLI